MSLSRQEQAYLRSAGIFFGFFTAVTFAILGYDFYRYNVIAKNWTLVPAHVIDQRYALCGKFSWGCQMYHIGYSVSGTQQEIYRIQREDLETHPFSLKIDPKNPHNPLLDPWIGLETNLHPLGMIGGTLLLFFFANRLLVKKNLH